MKMRVFTYLLLFFSLNVLGKSDSTQHSPKELLQTEDYEAALALLEPKLQYNPSFSELYNAGLAYAETKQYRKSLWAFESALKIDPLNTKAQSNAAFVHKKLNPDESWSNPYSWMDRMVVAFRSIWVPLILITSLTLAVSIFLLIGKIGIKWPWVKKLWGPSLVILVLSLIGINKLNEHATQNKFAIPIRNEVKIYLNPDGMTVKDGVNLSLRNQLNSYNQDSTWISIIDEQERIWLKAEDLLAY